MPYRGPMKRIPDWLIGLVLALIVVVLLFVVLDIGDTPTLATE